MGFIVHDAVEIKNSGVMLSDMYVSCLGNIHLQKHESDYELVTNMMIFKDKAARESNKRHLDSFIVSAPFLLSDTVETIYEKLYTQAHGVYTSITADP